MGTRLSKTERNNILNTPEKSSRILQKKSENIKKTELFQKIPMKRPGIMAVNRSFRNLAFRLPAAGRISG